MKNLILIHFTGADDDYLKEKPQSFLLTTPDMSSLSEKEQTDFLEMVARPYSGWTAGTCSAHWVDEIKPEANDVHFTLDRFIKYVCAEFGIEDTREWWQLPGIEDDQDMFDIWLPISISMDGTLLTIESVHDGGYCIGLSNSNGNVFIYINRHQEIERIASVNFNLLTKVIACYARACKKIG